jgi:hypothetical protein
MRSDAKRPTLSDEILHTMVESVGGRLSYLGKIAKAREPEANAAQLLAVEKAWLLGQIGLIPDHDDDVMDEASVCRKLGPTWLRF